MDKCLPPPRRAAQQIPAPQGTAWMQKPKAGAKSLVQIPGCARGGMVMDEIDICIMSVVTWTAIYL